MWEIHDFKIQEQLQDPIAFTATSNPDTMYYSDALRAPDREQFIKGNEYVVAQTSRTGKERNELC